MGGHTRVILCVDDDSGVIAALRRVLCDDFVVLTATNVVDGVQRLKDNPEISAIVSDHRMPGVNGLDFLTWSQINYPSVVRIALTGYPESELMKEALDNGLVAHVVAKPWNNKDIVMLLKTAIQQSGGVS